jgi:predicted esterase
MRTRLFSLLSLFSVVASGLAATTAACSSPDSDPLAGHVPVTTVAESPQPAPTTTASAPRGFAPPPAAAPVDDPGPAPAGCGEIAKDQDGFFTRTTAKSPYVGFVPKSYAGQPTMLVVGMHGCGDNAQNFAGWGVNPYDSRETQAWIGISIGGRDGECWDTSHDADKVLAAIADVSTCFYVHKQKVVLAGYSSGGILAYEIGLSKAASFAGIVIENSGLGSTQPSQASWKINVAHIAHESDQEFPIAGVHSDWAKLEAAGIPLQKSEVAGAHDGTTDDWAGYLLPKIGAWKAP